MPRLDIASPGYDDVALDIRDGKEESRVTIGNEELKNTVIGSTEHRAESSIVLFRDNGKVLWSQP